MTYLKENLSKAPHCLMVILLLVVTDVRADQSAGHSHSSEGASWDVGLSLEYVYLEGHSSSEAEHHEDEHEERHSDGDESAVGTHFHIIRKFSTDFPPRLIGIGAGAEVVFTDNPHYNLMGTVALYPWRDLVVSVSPGIEFDKHDGRYLEKFSMHYDIGYGFDLNGLHIGPVIGLGRSGGTNHYFAGLHVDLF
ncbi:MAG: hypothetical protein D6719_05445 [Candidatus Dadabacteria bacterium]|nr:MAG: hypothetical protein D6719_05445 [Candidatus Dadabacteria bacterium]